MKLTTIIGTTIGVLAAALLARVIFFPLEPATPRAVDVGLCTPLAAVTRPCVMQTARCTFVVSADDKREPLATAMNCRDEEYSDPCLPEWSGFRTAIARDRGLDIICRTGT